MSGGRRYLLDANVFIEAKDRYYGFDLCPGFWTSLIYHHRKGSVFSIDKIKDELKGGSFDSWLQDVPNTFFKQTKDVAVLNTLRNSVRWVNSNTQFTAAAKAQFAASADGWLVAYAKVNGMVVVTQEVYEPAAQNRVKIPNVCIEFGVQSIDTFEMLTELGVTFVRRTKR